MDELKQQQALILCSSSPAAAALSPSHEFSFTIPPLINSSTSSSSCFVNNKNKPQTTTTTTDLSPADDIFFHGHLLPLHLLSHLPISPRNSIDSFTLPIQELHHHHHNQNTSNIINNKKKEDEFEPSRINNKPKAKSFSIFGRSKWTRQQQEENNEKKKPRFEVSQMFKRYMRMVRPLLSMNYNKSPSSSKSRGGSKQPYSFSSGNISLRHDDYNEDNSFEESNNSTRRRREFSAPASMWTSPSNSGILMAAAKGGKMINNNNNVSSSPHSSSSDSTMEELQAAIQAAITHCKNSQSIAIGDP